MLEMSDLPRSRKVSIKGVLVNLRQKIGLLLCVAHARQAFSHALTEALRFDLIRFLAKGMS